jgi:hypothetical protein
MYCFLAFAMVGIRNDATTVCFFLRKMGQREYLFEVHIPSSPL